MWCVRRDGGGLGAGGWHSAGGGARVYRGAVPTGLARQAGGGAERGDAGRDEQRVTGGVSDRSGAGAGARAGAQTRDQAGGPAAQLRIPMMSAACSGAMSATDSELMSAGHSE